MQHIIDARTIEEPVKRFLEGLDISPEASVVEIDGRRVYLVVRPAREGQPSEPWDDTRAQRRYDLIEKKLDARLSPLEMVELAELEEQFDRYLHRVAPLPLDRARELLRKVQSQAHSGQDPS